MRENLVIAFRGSLRPIGSRVPGETAESDEALVEYLNRNKGEIESDICTAVRDELGSIVKKVSVQVEFKTGSVEWWGYIRAGISLLSDIGGVLALAEMATKVVDWVVNRKVRSRPHARQARYRARTRGRVLVRPRTRLEWDVIALGVLLLVWNGALTAMIVLGIGR